MAKLIITEKQYNAILEHVKQLKGSINESDKAITIDLDVLLALGSILEFDITGHNEIKAENALKDVKTFQSIKDILTSEDKIKELIKSFEIKGMSEPAKKLSDDKSKLISKFNKLSKENGFDVKLGSKELVNLHHLGK
jgi:hypothetical protein